MLSKHTALVIILIGGLSSVSYASTSPTSAVKEIADPVINELKASPALKSDKKALRQIAESKVLPKFDLQSLCKSSLGKYWKEASDKQKESFQVECKSLVSGLFVKAMASYDMQTIKWTKEAIDGNKAKVGMKVSQPGSSAPLEMTYQLVQSDQETWKVTDVAIDGISLLATYRSQFSNEIGASGLDGLISKLHDKNN